MIWLNSFLLISQSFYKVDWQIRKKICLTKEIYFLYFCLYSYFLFPFLLFAVVTVFFSGLLNLLCSFVLF